MSRTLEDVKCEKVGLVLLAIGFLSITLIIILLGAMVSIKVGTFASIPLTLSVLCFLKVAFALRKRTTYWTGASITVGVLGAISLFVVGDAEVALKYGNVVYYLV